MDDYHVLMPNASLSALTFVMREGNKATHSLASLAFDVIEEYWVKEVPHQLGLIIQNDVSNFDFAD